MNESKAAASGRASSERGAEFCRLQLPSFSRSGPASACVKFDVSDAPHRFYRISMDPLLHIAVTCAGDLENAKRWRPRRQL